MISWSSEVVCRALAQEVANVIHVHPVKYVGFGNLTCSLGTLSAEHFIGTTCYNISN